MNKNLVTKVKKYIISELQKTVAHPSHKKRRHLMYGYKMHSKQIDLIQQNVNLIKSSTEEKACITIMVSSFQSIAISNVSLHWTLIDDTMTGCSIPWTYNSMMIPQDKSALLLSQPLLMEQASLLQSSEHPRSLLYHLMRLKQLGCTVQIHRSCRRRQQSLSHELNEHPQCVI